MDEEVTKGNGDVVEEMCKDCQEWIKNSSVALNFDISPYDVLDDDDENMKR